MTYLDKAALLAALTNTHEKTIDSPLLGGRILIREITARQRLHAQSAASAENELEPDNALYKAMLIQMAVVDPNSGVRDMQGRIDPRTRAPLFTVEELLDISNGRVLAIDQLIDEITTLAGLGPAAMFSGGDAPNSSERDAGASIGGVGATAIGDEAQRTGDDDKRSAHSGRAGKK